MGITFTRGKSWLVGIMWYSEARTLYIGFIFTLGITI